MNVIVINFSEIESKINTSLLLQKINKPNTPDSQYDTGIVLLLNENKNNITLQSLENKNFLDNIVYSCWIDYNEKKEICVLNNINFFPKILPSLYEYIPNISTIWISIPIHDKEFDKKVKDIIFLNFNHPYITSHTPSNKNIPISIALTKNNKGNEEKNNPEKIMLEVKYVLNQHNSTDKCTLYAKFTKKAIAFLRKLSKIGFIKKNQKYVKDEKGESQKELSGELHVSDVKEINNKIIFFIDVNKQSIQSGDEENVDVEATRYNFHSHPEQAYIRHSVDKAWPSVTDYLGYLNLGKNTIFHCVATLEGLYIISFGKYWGEHINKVDKKFVKKNYDIDHNENLTPTQYVQKINNILYKKHSIFLLKFFPWEKATTIFSVNFSPNISVGEKLTESCIVSQKNMDRLKFLYK